MKIIRSFLAAISTYSRIPVPPFKLEEESDLILIFFPIVGIVIGAVELIWRIFCKAFPVGDIAYIIVSTVIPLLVTGGIHMDGYMDTSDALSSFGDRDKKLKILSDPVVGAFAVIRAIVLILLFLAGISGIKNNNSFYIFCLVFVLARVLSALSSFLFPIAKKTGMLYTLTRSKKRSVIACVLIIEAAAVVIIMFIITPASVFVVLSALLCLLYYYFRSKAAFGGVTGDTAGWFLCLCELLMTLVTAFLDIVS